MRPARVQRAACASCGFASASAQSNRIARSARGPWTVATCRSAPIRSREFAAGAEAAAGRISRACQAGRRPAASLFAAAPALTLAESEDRFRSLLRFSYDWYWEQDENFRFTANLRGFPERPGIRAGSYVGKTRWEMPCFGVSEAQWQAHKRTLQAHQPFYDFEYLRSSIDGQFRWVSVSGEPVFDAQGRFRGYRGIGKDITEHKQAQQRQAIEHAVAQILSDADALSEAVPRIIQSVCETMGWDYGARWQYGAHDDSYTCAELWCRPELRDGEFVAATRAKRLCRRVKA